jgi:hypothetical protein
MKLTPKDVEEFKSILAACKVLGIDGVVIYEGMARGVLPSTDAAIISKAKLSISEALRIGIGRVAELEKRLAIFTSYSPHDWVRQGDGYRCVNCERISKTKVGELENNMTAGLTCTNSNNLNIEGKVNEAGDVSMLTISSGKTKVQFRCTSVNLMKYPKSNEDEPIAVIWLNKTEITQVSRAVKTLGAEAIVLQVSRAGIARLECADSARDRFDIELSRAVEFVQDPDGIVQTYFAGLFVDMLDAAAKDTEEIALVLGQVGSITGTIKGHTVFLMPRITGED